MIISVICSKFTETPKSHSIMFTKWIKYRKGSETRQSERGPTPQNQSFADKLNQQKDHAKPLKMIL